MSSSEKLLTVYARKEPTTDPLTMHMGPRQKQDTVFYKDQECTRLIARKPWYQTGHPRKNTRSVVLNCYNWNLVWVAATPVVAS